MNSTSPFALNFVSCKRASRAAKVREAVRGYDVLSQSNAQALTPKELRFLEAQRAKVRPARFYAVHCAHDKPMWMPCSAATCRRSKIEAEQNWQKLLSGQFV